MNLGTERSETMTKRQKGEMKLSKRRKARTTRENWRSYPLWTEGVS